MVAGVYGGVSAQDRVSSRRERLVEAALELLGTQGRARTSVRAVCREANLSSRFFYESFADLDELVAAVFDAVASETLLVIVAAGAAAGDAPRARAEAAIGTWIGHMADDPRRARLLNVEAPGDPVLAPRRRALLREVARLLSAQAQELYHPPPRATALVDVTAAMLAGGMAELMGLWLDGALAHTREELAADCVEVFMATVEGAVTTGGRSPRAQ